MTIKLRTAALAAAFVFASAGASAQVEISQNGGFETGDFTGWEQFPNQGTQTITTFNPSTGTFAANLSVSDVAGNSLIKNANIGQGIVNPGDEIMISFDARGSVSTGGVAFAEFFSELDGGGTSSAEILGGGPLALAADPEEWTTFTFTAIAGPDVSGGVTLQLLAACGAAPGCNADIYFDNISVTAVRCRQLSGCSPPRWACSASARVAVAPEPRQDRT